MRISVDQYHAMIAAGVFGANDRVELLEGWMVPRMPKNPPHRLATGLLLDILTALLPVGWHVQVQDPVTTDDSEPEPDIGVVRGKRRDYPTGHPTPRDAALIVEVSDTALTSDRGTKKRIYARAAVPIYWIVNLPDRCVEVFWDPTGPEEKPDYRGARAYGIEEKVPVILDGVEIGQVEVKAIMP